MFVDFTAEWCATCKVNERTSIKTDEIQKAFKDNNIEFVVADYTTKNPKITEILQKYDRSGVPLYLLYPADKTKDATCVLEAEVQLCDESSFGAVRNDSAKNIVDCIKQYGQLQVNQVRLLSTIWHSTRQRLSGCLTAFARTPAGG